MNFLGPKQLADGHLRQLSRQVEFALLQDSQAIVSIGALSYQCLG